MSRKQDLNDYTEKELKSYFHSLGNRKLTNTFAFAKVKLLLGIKFGCKPWYLQTYGIQNEQSNS